MSDSLPTNTRRIFLRKAVGIAFGGADLGYGAKAGDDPFEALPKSVWARARNNGLVMIRRPAPAVLTRQATIVPPGEPGTPLNVAGRVFAPDGTTPVGDITVYAYNTDADGYYGANHTEYPPRLYGWMKTDAGGGFELHTILPGRYPGMHVPAHVHFTLWGESYPPQWAEDLRFEGDSYLTPEMLAESRQQGTFASIRPLTRSGDGALFCRMQIRLQRETNYR